MRTIIALIIMFFTFNITSAQTYERSPEGEKLYKLGFAHMEKEEYQLALKYYKELVSIDSEYALNYFALAQANYFSKNYIETLEACNEGLKYDKNESLFYYFRGLAYLKLNKNDLACKEFEISGLTDETTEEICSKKKE
jgi:tetratricopeptide (TPR) repeat protein